MGGLLGRAVFPVEEGDRQAVKGLVRRLSDNGVDDLELRMLTDPGGDLLAEVLALLCHRGGEDLDSVETCGRVVLILCHRLSFFLPGGFHLCTGLSRSTEVLPVARPAATP